MRLPAILFGLLLLAAAAHADDIVAERRANLYRGPFPGKAVLVFCSTDHAKLTDALRGTRYEAAFRRAKVARVLRDGAVPGLIPVILEPADADRLRRDLDRGSAVGAANGHLRDVLHATAMLAWASPDDPERTSR